MSSAKQKSRTERAFAARDTALRITQMVGAKQSIDGIPLTFARFNGITIAYRDQAIRDPNQPRGVPVYQFGIDLWHGHKVLSLEWNEGAEGRIGSFKGGEWEALLARANTTEAANYFVGETENLLEQAKGRVDLARSELARVTASVAAEIAP